MAIPFLNNIDLSDNELQNAKLHITGTAPAAEAAQIYYNSGNNTARYYNGTAWVELVASTGGTVTSVTSGNANTITIGGTATDPTVAANTAAVTTGSLNLVTGDQVYDFVTGSGYVESVGIGNSTFISLVDTGTLADPVLTASLSASGTPNATNFLRGDNTWAVVDSSLTLTGDVTGSGTNTVVTTISAGAVDFAMINTSAVITESEGIGNNDNDTTWPTTAAVKSYVDSSNVGQLIYQGGYNAATNTPNLDATPTITIKVGFTWTVTTDGSFYSEQVRVGDMIIANVNTPTTLADWTTVQNNIDLASAATIGIGNVVPGASNTITAPYTNGTATLDVVNSTASQKGAVIVSSGTGISVAYSNGTATVTNTNTNASNTATGTIAIGALSGTVTHNFGINTMVQTIDSSGNTVICDISRTATTSVATIAATESTAITILVQKIG
tara:strand:+ start:5915 stop:7243 length:1329 start_codon:yes stop_codon:yes gene_type:complete